MSHQRSRHFKVEEAEAVVVDWMDPKEDTRQGFATSVLCDTLKDMPEIPRQQQIKQPLTKKLQWAGTSCDGVVIVRKGKMESQKRLCHEHSWAVIGCSETRAGYELHLVNIQRCRRGFLILFNRQVQFRFRKDGVAVFVRPQRAH
jgi:hypothetical protein